jgi:hypothetical protein
VVGAAESTITKYERVLFRFIAFLGHDDGRSVTAVDVVRFNDHRLREQGASPKTIKDGDLAALKSIFGWAVDNRKLSVNPAAGVTIKVQAFAFIELPDWLTLDLILRILENKAFSAVYWLAAAVVAIVGFIARMKYRDRNLKRLLDAYLEKARKSEGKERESVKEVIGRAIRKARGLPVQGSFNPADVFEDDSLDMITNLTGTSGS